MFATDDAAGRAFHRVTDRTVGCAGQTTAMHLEDGTTEVWSFGGAAPTATDAVWVKQEPVSTGAVSSDPVRENVLLQARSASPATAGPRSTMLAGAMENTLGR